MYAVLYAVVCNALKCIGSLCAVTIQRILACDEAWRYDRKSPMQQFSYCII